MVLKLKKLLDSKKTITLALLSAALILAAVLVATSPLLIFQHKAKAATTSISGEKAISAISNPNYIISGSGQGQIQCPANPASTNAYRSLQLTFGGYRAGESITGSFDISNNRDGRSVIGGSIDGGQIIQDHFTLTGTTRETFGFVCGSSSSSSSTGTSSSSGAVGGVGNGNSNNGVPTLNTLAVPTHFTISGQCGSGGRIGTAGTTTTTTQFMAANGETGTFAGPVSCNLANTNNNAASSSPSSTTQQQQYQSQNPDQDLYSSYRNSNEYKQGSIAYQQCIDAAAKVGNKLSDYEITNCQKNPSYRH